MNHFAAQLTTALRQAKISKSELARRIPCPRCSISDWCSGRHQPRPQQLDRINIILGTKLTLARTVKANEVARALGMCKDTLYRAMREGKTDVGFAVRSRNGKRYCYRFYPAVVAAKCGI
jgi:transcriptional regulator with XRE-family HTH domain